MSQERFPSLASSVIVSLQLNFIILNFISSFGLIIIFIFLWIRPFDQQSCAKGNIEVVVHNLSFHALRDLLEEVQTTQG